MAGRAPPCGGPARPPPPIGQHRQEAHRDRDTHDPRAPVAAQPCSPGAPAPPAAVAAARRRAGSPRRRLSGRRRRRPRRTGRAPRRHRRLGVDADRTHRPTRRSGPTRWRRAPLRHLRLRLPRRHRPDATPGHRTARAGPDQRAGAGLRRGGTTSTDHPDQPRAVAATGPRSTATPSTGTASSTRSRCSTACPSCRSSVPIGRDFTYFYRPHDAGTYMYHCHFEDVEHVQMGMTGHGVRPAEAERDAVAGYPAGRSTPTTTATGRPRYDREFAVHVTEICGRRRTTATRTSRSPTGPTTTPSFWLLNGRALPGHGRAATATR